MLLVNVGEIDTRFFLEHAGAIFFKNFINIRSYFLARRVKWSDRYDVIKVKRLLLELKPLQRRRSAFAIETREHNNETVNRRFPTTHFCDYETV
jgi:hypothetical protein